VTEHPSGQQLQIYLDGELAPEEQTALESHLRECAGCQETLDELRSLFQLIESVPERALERDLAPQVMNALRPAMRWLPSVALGELVAALGIAAALVIGLGRATVELNLSAAIARLARGIESAVVDLSATISDGIGQLPVLSAEDFVLELPSAGMAWTIAAGALALWAVGNGLVLRRVRRKE
jgi:anti-sigma factor RsiW